MSGIYSSGLVLHVGRAACRSPMAYSIEICALKRAQYRVGEITRRINIRVGIERPRRVFGTPRRTLFGWIFFAEIYLIPAWRDVPSVVAEYRRTME